MKRVTEARQSRQAKMQEARMRAKEAERLTADANAKRAKEREERDAMEAKYRNGVFEPPPSVPVLSSLMPVETTGNMAPPPPPPPAAFDGHV